MDLNRLIRQNPTTNRLAVSHRRENRANDRVRDSMNHLIRSMSRCQMNRANVRAQDSMNHLIRSMSRYRVNQANDWVRDSMNRPIRQTYQTVG